MRHFSGVFMSASEFEAALDENGELSEAACEALCRADFCGSLDAVHGCAVVDTVSTDSDSGVDDDVVVSCDVTGVACCMGGRGHDEVESGRGRGPTRLARWLATAASAERDSVKAFVSLGRELAALGAPEELVVRCRLAARQEVAHARILGALARASGGTPARPRFRPPADRRAVDIAIENAVEGRVRETWAATVAAWQASRATQPMLRWAFGVIANDESEHAELARAIGRWLNARLTDEERAMVAREHATALGLLHDGLDDPGTAIADVGLPSPADTRTLFNSIDWT